MREWPDYADPTTSEPELTDLLDWEARGIALATDGCEVEPDGECEHGHCSWLVRLGLI